MQRVPPSNPPPYICCEVNTYLEDKICSRINMHEPHVSIHYGQYTLQFPWYTSMKIIHHSHASIMYIGNAFLRKAGLFSKQNSGKKLRIRMCGDVKHPAYKLFTTGLSSSVRNCTFWMWKGYTAEYSRLPCGGTSSSVATVIELVDEGIVVDRSWRRYYGADNVSSDIAVGASAMLSSHCHLFDRTSKAYSWFVQSAITIYTEADN
ncbi:hypothetical protein NPIL_127941 [Nephila pilipes]|uniref:Uncharacterized protein n=1 Tax=Nephila pilipes TaxID=299642 RepID=A0A8X6QP65_NEPPI|nr:hypothetical protein NPIL_127941 [Nephila pilipes]